MLARLGQQISALFQRRLYQRTQVDSAVHSYLPLIRGARNTPGGKQESPLHDNKTPDREDSIPQRLGSCFYPSQPRSAQIADCSAAGHPSWLRSVPLTVQNRSDERHANTKRCL